MQQLVNLYRRTGVIQDPKKKRKTEKKMESGQTSGVVFFCENSQRLKAQRLNGSWLFSRKSSIVGV